MGGIEGVKLYCPMNAEKRGGIILFEAKGVDSTHLAVALDEKRQIAVRSGLMCAEPIVKSINPHGLARASFYIYNTIEEIDTLVEEVAAISRVLG